MISVRCSWLFLTVLLHFLLNLFSQTDAKNVSSKGYDIIYPYVRLDIRKTENFLWFDENILMKFFFPATIYSWYSCSHY